MFIFTNGDAVAQGLREASVRGEIYPWRDVLHEGPVPAVELSELSTTRANWLAAQQWGDGEQIAKFFRRRDAALLKSRRHKRTELWFEHDLYDQLQLIQILGELATRKADPRRYAMVCIDAYPGVEDFRGLGQLSPEQLATLHDQLVEVTEDQLALAKTAWDAFRAPDPSDLAELAARLDEDAPLPFLGAALRRLLAQYPAVGSGLDRIERWILEGVADRTRSMVELFVEVGGRDTAPYLGDQTFYAYVARLANAKPALITTREQDFPQRATYVQLTDDGRRCLDGDLDLATTLGWHRWLGGVELSSEDGGPTWRYSADAKTLVRS